MAKVRSPNYPNVPLGAALEAIRPAYQKDHRNKMSRAVLAKHLGYSSLNGRALGKIGAIRAYGLIEGSGDELKISDVAVRALAAPTGSPERMASLSQMASRPTLFADIRKQFPDNHPSPDNLVYWLATQNFTQSAAEKAAKSYLSTMNLVAGIPDSYNPGDDEEESEGESSAERGAPRGKAPPPPPPPPPAGKVKMMDGEREIYRESGDINQYIRVIASGDLDESLLDAVDGFVKRQKERLRKEAKRKAEE